jgi:hypothetical protein
MRRSLGAISGLVSVASGLACQHSSDSPFLAPGANSLGLTALSFRIDEDFLIAAIPEEGLDLNGDGDTLDSVLEFVHLRTGRKTVLPYSVGDSLVGGSRSGFQADGGFVSFGVSEYAQGADLDGDGDIDGGNVLLVYDVRTGQTANLGLAVRIGGFGGAYVAQDGPLIGFVVPESVVGRDLDGDGETNRNLVYTYEADIERLTQLFSVATDMRPILEDGRLLVAAQEAGFRDRNGDGDTSDQVLLVHDVRTGAAQNLARAVQPAFANLPRLGVEESLLALEVSESAQGVDLNADGDLLDTLVEIRDLETGTILPTGLQVLELRVEGGLVAMYAPELGLDGPVGTDLNGDGDVLDTVAFFYDGLTGTLTNTGVTVGDFVLPRNPPLAMGDRRAALVVIESAQGDLNGDGDSDDHVLEVFDARTGRTDSTGIAVWTESGVLDIDREHVLCAAVGADGTEPRVVDLQTGAQHGIGLASVSRLSLAEGRALVSVYESIEGDDLDGDGDMQDVVQVVHDLQTGRTFNTGLAHFPSGFPPLVEFERGRLAMQALEDSQGRDLNSDGDMEDFVLHVVRVP